MNKKIFWLIAYVATGAGMMGEALLKKGDGFTIAVLGIGALFYAVTLRDHYKELKG
ncbi:hypothetical protein [Natronincola ferrireducens]|uniref:Uncharacterized protein n=1 Tax=Natronincola ferrireducens TaxID=393762 RepID=A0A1G9G451_9FIRM|nr:hypothetical protein [Natronincola ferrireducens]SDK95421.1 hypothetical protein SAMN05660472_02344 [Natronincola ferrireducens]